MAQDHPDDDARLNLIHLAVEEVVAFYAYTVQAIFYPEESSATTCANVAGMLDDLIARDRAAGGPMATDLVGIQKLYRELADQAKLFIESGRRNQWPMASSFDEHSQMFEELIRRLRRLEQKQYLVGAGYDVASGLRSADMVEKDMARELEHVARRGSYFSLILIRLEKADGLCLSLGGKFVDLLRWLGDHIQKNGRVFDDAYRLDKDLFLLTLKHTDDIGVKSYIARLMQNIETHPFIADGEKFEARLTFCTAQPMVGEDIPALLESMRRDLGDENHANREVVSYQEVSPLQKFMNGQRQGELS